MQGLIKKIINEIRKKPRTYDCLITVSGGKDSTWQVYIVKKFGLNPLAVTYKTPLRTKIGQQNPQEYLLATNQHFRSTVLSRLDILAEMAMRPASISQIYND